MTGEGVISNFEGGSVGDILSLCFQLNYIGDNPNTEEVVFTVYLAENINGITVPNGTCFQNTPGTSGQSFQELISVSTAELSGNWQEITIPSVAASINYSQLILEVRAIGQNDISWLDAGKFFVDNILLEEIEVPVTHPEVSILDTNNLLCEGGGISFTYEICSDSPVEIGLSAISSVEWLTAAPVSQTITLPDNGSDCTTITVNYSQDQDANTAQSIDFSLLLTSTYDHLPCLHVDRSAFSHIYSIDCLANFTCLCPGTNAIYIDAGDIDNNEELLFSNSALANNLNNSSYSANTYDNDGGCIAIRGRLVINGDYAIVGGEILMQPGSEIVVRDGDKFSIAETLASTGGGTIHSCEEMWRGIKVEEGGAINFRQNEIRDAQYAIQAEVTSTLEVVANHFYDNYVGIYVPPSGTSPGSQSNVGQPFPVVLCQFATVNGLLPPYSTQSPMPSDDAHAGILINDCRLFEVGAAFNPFSANEFHDIENGILAYNSGLRVGNCSFDDLIGDFNVSIISNPPLKGLGIASFGAGTFESIENDFDNMERGIHIQNAHLGFINISRCTLSNVQDGIIITSPVNQMNVSIAQDSIEFRRYGIGVFDGQGLTNVRVLDNNLEVVSGGVNYGITAGIRLSNISAPASLNFDVINNHINLSDIGFGIFADECIKPRLLGNVITYDGMINDLVRPQAAILSINNSQALIYNNNLTDSHTGAFGLTGIRNIFSPQSTICCNTTDGHDVGVSFRGMAGDTDFRQSNLNGHDVGLLYLNDAITGVQEDAGNEWLGTYSDVAARHFGGVFVIGLSPYLVEPPMTSSLWPASIDLPNGGGASWFTSSFGTAATNCITDESCQDALSLDKYTRLDTTIVDGSLLSNTSDTVLAWRAAQHLYRKISVHRDSLPSDSLMNDFYTSLQNLAIGKLDSVAWGIRHLIDYGSTTSLAIAENQLLMDAYLEELNELDSLLAIATTAIDSASLIGQRQTAKAEIDNTLTLLDSLGAITQSERMTNASSLNTFNQSISTGNLPEAAYYEKVVNGIYLDHIANGHTSFDSLEYDMLLNIAGLCPDVGGRAVVLARALVLTHESMDFDDDSLCSGRSSFSAPEAVQKAYAGKLTIVPNPARGNTRIIWGQGHSASHLTIYRLDGSELLITPLPEGQAAFELDVSRWQSGMYIILVQFADGQHQIGKLIK
jgi:hypothetical protein